MEEVDEPNPGVAIILSGGEGCHAGSQMLQISDSVHSDVSPDFGQQLLVVEGSLCPISQDSVDLVIVPPWPRPKQQEQQLIATRKL